MLICAKLVLAAVLAFSPLLESFDKWEQPWSGDSSGEMVFTLLSCALALGYAAVRRWLPALRKVILSGLINTDSTILLFVRRALQRTRRQLDRASPFPSPPLRV